MNDALVLLQAFNRTNSLPSNLTDAPYDLELPSVLEEVLAAPRETFNPYHKRFFQARRLEEVTKINDTKTAGKQMTEKVSTTPSNTPCRSSSRLATDQNYHECTKVETLRLPIVPNTPLRPDPDLCVASISGTAEKPEVLEAAVHTHHAEANDPLAAETTMDIGVEHPKRGERTADTREAARALVTAPFAAPTPPTSLPLGEDVPTCSPSMRLELEKTGNNSVKPTPNPEQREQHQDEGQTLPTLVNTDVCIPYDPQRIMEWMLKYVNCRTHCPPGITRFLQTYSPANVSPSSASTADHSHAQVKSTSGVYPIRVSRPPSFKLDPAFGANPVGECEGKSGAGMIGGRSGNFRSSIFSPGQNTGSHNNRSSTSFGKDGHPTGLTALQAIAEIWEDRKTTPIAVPVPPRQRGLFGAATKKEVQHMVLSLLNKVSPNAEKFQDVKKELLRLPIPEANPEQLATIVDIFFKKAIREQHFSRSYADLMSALCKVPQGQHITGDKVLSLEYRMRHALLKRSQETFVDGMQMQKTDASEMDTEEFKEKRNMMVGNVRFVGELFLNGVIPDSIIGVIFQTCCTGLEGGAFSMPPTYVPTELEVDQITTLTDVVGASFFVQTKRGRDLLSPMFHTLQYWVEHHTLSRCRFLLMSNTDKLSRWLSSLGVPPTSSSSTSSTPAIRVPQSVCSLAQQPIFDLHATAASPTHAGCLQSISQSPKDTPIAKPFEAPLSGQNTSHSSCSTSVVFSNSPIAGSRLNTVHQSASKQVMVGSRPIPAPRSTQNRASLNIPSSPPTTEHSLSLPQGTSHRCQQRLPAPVAPYPVAALLPTAQPQARPLAKPEAIAKDMAQLKNGVVRVADVLEGWSATYDDMLPILTIWIDRCLSVVREEPNRLETGQLLVLLLQRSGSRYQRGQLRKLFFEGLERALDARLHEDLKLFKFWAQIILSDRKRVVLDEELLEDALEHLIEHRPSVVQSYLVEVGEWYTSVQSGRNHLSAWDESKDFVRYRPLVCQEFCYATSNSLTREARRMENFSDVRRTNLEFDVYHTLLRESPPNIEGLFENLRTSSRLKHDYSLAAEILCAVLMAEMNSPENCIYLDNCIPLLQIAIDGPNRRDRELALVAEVYEIYGIFQQKMSTRTHTNKQRVLSKLRFFHVVSDESLDRIFRFFEDDHENERERLEVESASSPRPPKQIEGGRPTPMPDRSALVLSTPLPICVLSAGGGSGETRERPRKVSSGNVAGHSNERSRPPPCGAQSAEENGNNRATCKSAAGHRTSGGAIETIPGLGIPSYPMMPQMMPSHANFNNSSWMTPMGLNQQHQAESYYRGAGRHNHHHHNQSHPHNPNPNYEGGTGSYYNTRNHARGGSGGRDEGKGRDPNTGASGTRHERRRSARGGGNNRGNA